jgi:peptidoglycan/LPS O-acetylase OafA/YrhL
LYLWHFGVLWLVLIAFGHSMLVGALGIALSFGVAEVSWRFVEWPFLTTRQFREPYRELPARRSTSSG